MLLSFGWTTSRPTQLVITTSFGCRVMRSRILPLSVLRWETQRRKCYRETARSSFDFRMAFQSSFVVALSWDHCIPNCFKLSTHCSQPVRMGLPDRVAFQFFTALILQYGIVWAPTFSERRSQAILSIYEKPTIATLLISSCKMRMSCSSFYERGSRPYVTRKVRVKTNFHHLLYLRCTTLDSASSASSPTFSRDDAKPDPKIAENTNDVGDRHESGQDGTLDTS